MSKGVLWAFLIFSALAVALFACAKASPVNTENWLLSDFVGYLRAKGMKLTMIPTRKNGERSNSVYLSEDPCATWLSLQGKKQNPEFARQWQGTVWVEHLPADGAIECYVGDWGLNGCQIDRFVVFGDARLVEQVLQAFDR